MENTTSKQTTTTLKAKGTATILCLLLGAIGVHWFYLEQKKAIWYLLLCWTGIPLLISVIDFFVLFFMSANEFNSKYNPTFATTQ